MADGVQNYTKTGHIQHPAYNIVAQWVLDAWSNVNVTLIHKSFKYCGISNS